MKLRAYMDYVLVEYDDPNAETPGGLVIPANARKDRPYGTVISVGPCLFTDDGKRIPIGVEVGDKVIANLYGVDPFDNEGKKVYMVREGSVVAEVLE